MVCTKNDYVEKGGEKRRCTILLGVMQMPGSHIVMLRHFYLVRLGDRRSKYRSTGRAGRSYHLPLIPLLLLGCILNWSREFGGCHGSYHPAGESCSPIGCLVYDASLMDLGIDLGRSGADRSRLRKEVTVLLLTMWPDAPNPGDHHGISISHQWWRAVSQHWWGAIIAIIYHALY